MATTTRFDKQGITTLAVFRDAVHMDFFGQGVIVQVPPLSENVLEGSEIEKLHAKLDRAMLQSLGLSRSETATNEDPILRGRRHVQKYLAPLLTEALPSRPTHLQRSNSTHDTTASPVLPLLTGTLPRRAQERLPGYESPQSRFASLLVETLPPRLKPAEKPESTCYSVSLVGCLYDGVVVLALRQSSLGKPCLTKLKPGEDAPGAMPENPVSICRGLPSHKAKQLPMRIVNHVTLDTIQGTVTLPDDKRYTCVMLRDVSPAGLRASTMAATLNAFDAANQIRESRATGTARERRTTLHVPRLIGYVTCKVLRGWKREEHIVGGIVQHISWASSWAPWCWEMGRKPDRAHEHNWALCLLDTVRQLHRKGTFWGGAVGAKCPHERARRIKESVDVDGYNVPWLMRNYAGPHVNQQVAQESDLVAFGDLIRELEAVRASQCTMQESGRCGMS